jgi:hypothetical protein
MMEVEHSSETDSLAYEEWAKERRDSTNVNYVETGCIIWHSIEKEGLPPEQTDEKYIISVEDGHTGKSYVNAAYFIRRGWFDSVYTEEGEIIPEHDIVTHWANLPKPAQLPKRPRFPLSNQTPEEKEAEAKEKAKQLQEKIMKAFGYNV